MKRVTKRSSMTATSARETSAVGSRMLPPLKDVSFADVEKDEWYAEGVSWAAKNGVVTGISADIFAPKDVYEALQHDRDLRTGNVRGGIQDAAALALENTLLHTPGNAVHGPIASLAAVGESAQGIGF